METVFTYLDGNHKHAVTHLGGVQKYWYDLNGNMITGTIGSTSKIANDATGAQTGMQLCRAWGENRHPTDSTLSTTTRSTGQRAETSLGIYFLWGSLVIPLS